MTQEENSVFATMTGCTRKIPILPFLNLQKHKARRQLRTHSQKKNMELDEIPQPTKHQWTISYFSAQPLALTKRMHTDKQKANLQREHITEHQKHAQAIQQQAWKVW